MQFLITGGTGFIGRYVTRRLLEQRARVSVFCRQPEKARRLFGDRVAVSRGDLCNPASVSAAVKGCDVVIHLVAVFQFGRAARQMIEHTNVQGTRHLLAAAEQSGVSRFVHVSSCGVMEGRGALLTEEDFPHHVSQREPYRRSKWLAELSALEAARKGLFVTIASPTSPLGSGDEVPTPTGQIVRDYLDGRFPVSARVGLNFIHVAELADGILAVAERGRAGERYLLGHHNVWLPDFLRVLARVTNGPCPGFILTQSAIALAGAIGEIMGSERMCWETAAHARRRQWFDFSKASNELGWRPTTSLQEIAEESIKWFQEGAPNLASQLAGSNVATH